MKDTMEALMVFNSVLLFVMATPGHEVTPHPNLAATHSAIAVKEHLYDIQPRSDTRRLVPRARVHRRLSAIAPDFVTKQCERSHDVQ
jgi:hypothetical protein